MARFWERGIVPSDRDLSRQAKEQPWYHNAMLPSSFNIYFTLQSISFFSSLCSLPRGWFVCPTTPIFSVLCFFLQFTVSLLFHHPVQQHCSWSALCFLSFHPSLNDIFKQCVTP